MGLQGYTFWNVLVKIKSFNFNRLRQMSLFTLTSLLSYIFFFLTVTLDTALTMSDP